jgi:3',5'-cyclic AMP phosphodiesterase CpdA
VRFAWSLLAALLLAPLAQAQPEQVHQGLPTSDPSTARSLLWLDAAPEAQPRVTLDTPAGPQGFAASLVPGPSAGFAYEARLTGLAPATRFAYHVGDRAGNLTTPPAGPGSFRFVALGDMDTTPQAHDTVRVLQELKPDFVLHLGDLSYAQGDPQHWADWFRLIEPVARDAPWLPVIGNHETYTGPGAPGVLAGEAAASPVEEAFFEQRFGLPGDEHHYSFDWQGAHFVGLTTWGDTAPLDANVSAAEVRWLDADLGAHENATWTFVFLHEPAYSSNSHGDSARVQQAIVPVLQRHGVDLLLAAHDHGYERSFPLRDGNATTQERSNYAKGQGIIEVVTGGAGAELYHFPHPQPAWSAARKDLYHVTVFDVSPTEVRERVVPTGNDSFADAFTVRAASLPAPAPERVPGAEGWLLLAPLAVGVLVRRRR